MDIIYYLLIGVSVLLIVLGFIALLTQKIYIDKETNEPTEVEVPIVGKIRTNYPALIFVFLGFSLAIVILERTSEQPQDEWTVRGRLSRDDGAEINWREGSIMLHPIGIETTIKDNGEFDITYFLEKGTSFYDKIKYIVYSHEEGNFTFYPKAEHEKYKNNDESTLIEKAGDYYINLKPSSFTPY